MNKVEIKIIRKSFLNFLKSDEPFYEFSVGSDLKIRNKISFKVLFPGIHRTVFYLRHIISRTAQFIDYSPIKILIYKLIGFNIGKGVFISPDVILDSQFPKLIEIGDYVVLGWGAKIFVHDFNGITYRIGRVKIGAGSIIGGFSFIRAGVFIEDNSLVKLGSIIFDNKNPNVIKQQKTEEIINNLEQR